jgi:hypothetical protein
MYLAMWADESWRIGDLEDEEAIGEMRVVEGEAEPDPAGHGSTDLPHTPVQLGKQNCFRSDDA